MALALGGSILASLPTQAQKAIRSVVVAVDSAGRLLPPDSTDLPAPNAKRYWADTPSNSIRRSNLDGSGVEEVASGLNVPYGLSFDAGTGSLLWTSSGDEVVQRLGGGSGPAVLPSSFEEPFAIVLELEGQRIAYALLEGEIVRVTQTSGSETEQIETLTQFGSVFAGLHGLALDEAAGILYLGDLNGMMTQRLRLSDGRVDSLLFVEEPFPGQPILEETPQ
jgi:hypothetical protein